MPTLDAYYSEESSETKNSMKDQKDPWKMLLKKKKVIKDPIHKDIWLTETELNIIDTKEFQRLRNIKQLGPAIFVYPGAQHSRFEHSIGTLYMAQCIMEAIRRNTEKSHNKLSDRDIFLIRIVALLHDLVHLPFGHTLEDEGRLFKLKQWKDTERREVFFFEISVKLKQSIEKAFHECGREDKNEIEKLLKDLDNILVAEEEGKVDSLEKPYLADIVGNTICADLFDYIKRDIYFTGITGEYDERVISYFALGKYNGNDRVIIKLFKDNKINGSEDKEIRRDILSAIIELLRLRYSLAEKVYYHHAKREASAMIIKMVACAMKGKLIDKKDLYDLNDASLIHFITEKKISDDISDENKIDCQSAKKIAEMLTRRELYKPVYEQKIINVENTDRIREVLDSWEKRLSMERDLEKLVGLEEGDIIIYIPKKDMSAKQAKVLVQLPNDDIFKLEDFGKKSHELPVGYKELSEIIDSELITLRKKHESLWKLSVFTKEKYLKDEKMNLIKSICQDWFEGHNPVNVAQIICYNHGISEPAAIHRIAQSGSTSLKTKPTSDNKSSFGYCIDKIEELINQQKKE